MDKLIVVINGKGGVGKDTLCDSVSAVYETQSISAIEPIKDIAVLHGWDGEKDERGRRFLAELKQAFIHYNDLPTSYLCDKTEQFLKSDSDILFVHIREPDQIQRFIDNIPHCNCVSILVQRDEIDSKHFGNDADDEVDNYPYDYVFENNFPIDMSKHLFISLIQRIMQ